MRRRISIIILSLALLLLFPTTIHGADTSGDTGNVNFIVISALHKVDGHVVPDTPAYRYNSETIEEEDTPLTGSFKNIEIAKPTEKWALVNLIITLIVLLMSGAFLFVRQKKHEDDDNEEAYKKDKKDLRFFKILGLFIAIVTILVFLFTEDLSLPMQLIDKWTIIMLLFFIDQIFVAFIVERSARGCKKDEEWTNY